MRTRIYKLLICVVAALAATTECVVAGELLKQPQNTTKKDFDRGIEVQTFMPKGSVMLGASFSYTNYGATDYQFLLFDNIKADAYMLGGRLKFAYTFANNVAAGVSFDYSRTLVDLGNVDMSLSEDLNFSVADYYSVQQVYTASAFLRTYVNIGNSKRLGMFNDVKVYFGGGQGKMTNGGEGVDLTGTYEKITKLGLVLAPGVTVFAADFMAVEASIGIFGVEYVRSEQITNQVYQGVYESFNAKFKLDLLSLELGMSFYF